MCLRLGLAFRQVYQWMNSLCAGGMNITKVNAFQKQSEAYREAIRLNPSSAEAYYRLGNSYVKMSRYGEAIVYYRSAIKLGSAYERIPGTIEAIQAYEQVGAIAPRSDVVNFILGAAYLKNGGDEKALSKYKVLEAPPFLRYAAPKIKFTTSL